MQFIMDVYTTMFANQASGGIVMLAESIETGDNDYHICTHDVRLYCFEYSISQHFTIKLVSNSLLDNFISLSMVVR
jgi:hypothetical protein